MRVDSRPFFPRDRGKFLNVDHGKNATRVCSFRAHHCLKACFEGGYTSQNDA